MKRRLWIGMILLLLIVSLACNLPSGLQSLIPGNSQTQSENRCGDGVCDGPENNQFCPQDCPLEGSQPDQSEPLSVPQWFASSGDCTLTETSVRSEGSPWAYDSQGNTTELLPDGKITCVLEIQICGDTIFKQQVIDTDQDCPSYLHYSYAPQTSVCCDHWQAAKQSASPCDPTTDADCDGVNNDNDSYPLDVFQQ